MRAARALLAVLALLLAGSLGAAAARTGAECDGSCASESAALERRLQTVPDPVLICSTVVLSFVEPKVNAFGQADVGQTLTSAEFETRYTGVTVNLIANVMRRLGWNYQVRFYTSSTDLLYAVREGATSGCHIGAAAISQTATRDRCDSTCPALTTVPSEANACCLDFTHDYLPSGASILSRSSVSSAGVRKLFEALVQPELINVLCWTFMALMVVAHIMWWVESGMQPKKISPKYLMGIDDALWLCLVTLTTVGYGDLAPVSGSGRIVAGVWMIIGLLFISTLSGILAAVWVETRLARFTFVSGLRELNGRTVCTTEGYLTELLASTRPAAVFVVPDQEACVVRVSSGAQETALLDWPVARGIISRGLVPDDMALTGILWPGDIALATREGWEHLGSLNEELLSFTTERVPLSASEKTHEVSVREFFPNENGIDSVANVVTFGDGETEIEKGDAQASDSYSWGVIGTTLALLAVYVVMTGLVWFYRRRVRLGLRVWRARRRRASTGPKRGASGNEVSPEGADDAPPSIHFYGALDRGLYEITAALFDLEQEDEKIDDKLEDLEEEEAETTTEEGQEVPPVATAKQAQPAAGQAARGSDEIPLPGKVASASGGEGLSGHEPPKEHPSGHPPGDSVREAGAVRPLHAPPVVRTVGTAGRQQSRRLAAAHMSSGRPPAGRAGVRFDAGTAVADGPGPLSRNATEDASFWELVDGDGDTKIMLKTMDVRMQMMMQTLLSIANSMPMPRERLAEVQQMEAMLGRLQRLQTTRRKRDFRIRSMKSTRVVRNTSSRVRIAGGGAHSDSEASEEGDA
ncbi:unnamed protein product [Pedinophyceae sp. YPF-701]|nr:unnamed protein product [Pedinophyceae sp. YPF-701]